MVTNTEWTLILILGPTNINQIFAPGIPGKNERVLFRYKTLFSYFCKTAKSLIMKKIEAIIRLSKYNDVKEALHQAGVIFLTYWDVTGVGHEEEGHSYRGVTYSTTDIQRRFISMVVNDDFEKITIDTLLKHAATGEVGDGKIFVSDIQESYRIRTSEKGVETLK